MEHKQVVNPRGCNVVVGRGSAACSGALDCAVEHNLPLICVHAMGQAHQPVQNNPVRAGPIREADAELG